MTVYLQLYRICDEIVNNFVANGQVAAVLDRLVQDGLVEHLPNRGAHVRNITVEEAIEMYEALAVIEGVAARYAAHSMAEHRTLVAAIAGEAAEQAMCQHLTHTAEALRQSARLAAR